MHHETSRLVHYKQVLVLEDNRDGDVLGRELLLQEPGLDQFPAAYLVRWSSLCAADPHEILLDHAPGRASAYVQASSEKPVQAFPGFFGRDLEVVALSHEYARDHERSSQNGIEARPDLFRLHPAYEDEFVPARGPFDYGNLRGRHRHEPRQIMLDLQVGLSLGWRCGDRELDRVLPVQ